MATRAIPFVFILALTFISLSCFRAGASIALLDKDEWKVLFGGFAETDIIYDSARSLTEVAGNNPIDRPGSFAGDNGRTQFSVRNSRIDFTILPPIQNEMKTKGFLELDFLGFDPGAGLGTSTQPVTSSNSEGSFYTNPTLRIRHAYVSSEKSGCQLLIGQYWTLFGWNPSYILTTASVPPVAGNVYLRTPQVLFIHTSNWGDDKFQYGLSIERPTERDSTIPNFDGGVRYTMGSRKAGYATRTGDVGGEGASIALTGTYRTYLTPTAGGGTSDTTRFAGGAGAVDAMIPVISSSDGKNFSNTLIVSGEFTSGVGYSDAFTSYTGNIAQTATGTPNTPSLDGGLGGNDTSGNFQLIKLQTFNGQLQYQLPSEWDSFINVGYSQLYGLNLSSFTSTKILYDRSDDIFINFFHNFTKQFRMALEFNRFSTHYIDGLMAYDSRFQVSAWFYF